MTEQPPRRVDATPAIGRINEEMSEADRRDLWSSVMDQIQEFAAIAEPEPFFATYGRKTEEADQRVLVIRTPLWKFNDVSYVAITADGPLALLVRPRLGEAISFNEKLDREKREPNEGGYIVKRDGDDITRTVTLGDERYSFTWSRRAEYALATASYGAEPATLARANGDSVDLAVHFAQPQRKGGSRQGIKTILREAIQTSGIPQSGFVPMWEGVQKPY